MASSRWRAGICETQNNVCSPLAFSNFPTFKFSIWIRKSNRNIWGLFIFQPFSLPRLTISVLHQQSFYIETRPKMHPLCTDWNQQFMCLDYFYQPLAYCMRHKNGSRRSLQRGSSLERWTDVGSYRVVLCCRKAVRECAGFAFCWTISFLPSFPFCTYRHTPVSKTVLWRWNRIEYSRRIHPKFISPHLWWPPWQARNQHIRDLPVCDKILTSG